jgi:CRP/FNR family transcriptional regulator, cyclic AMP receptor protein
MSSTAAGARKLAKDALLFKEGDPPDAMYIVKSGRLAVVKVKQDSEIILAEIGPGGMVGEMAFFDNKPRSATIKAIKDSEVVALPYKSLHAQFANFPEWLKAIMRTVNSSLRNANQRIKQLESGMTENEVFSSHNITKLIAILNFVGLRYGKETEDKSGKLINGNILRNYTIQVFQEATHKMQKLSETLQSLGYAKVNDTGEGRIDVILLKPDLLFGFVEWYNDWLFKRESDRFAVKDEQLKILKAILHFAKKSEKSAKGTCVINLTAMQAGAEAELGYPVKVEETIPFVQGGLMTEHKAEASGLTSTVVIDDIEKITPYWEIIHTLKKVVR